VYAHLDVPRSDCGKEAVAMRAALIVGGLVVAAGLGALGAVEAQNHAISTAIWSPTGMRSPAAIWSSLIGASPTTTAAAPAEKPPIRPQPPRTVVADVALPTQASAAPVISADVPTHVAAAAQAAPQPAPAPQAVPPSAQAAPPAAAPAPAAAAAPAGTPMPKAPPIVCNNPNALGLSRVVQIDTTGGPGFGMEHFRTHDFLNDHEVVLTFDDGPWLNNTPAVLKALADQCIRATFFTIGKHATYYPEILKQVAAAGHTIGSHTWSHKDLSKMSVEDAKTEIEMGMSAVKMSLGAPIAPFFRFPALKHPPELVTYLGERNVGIFSCDFDSFDFKMHRPEQVIKSVMDKLAKHGKGIILMHDFHKGTAEALPQLLAKLKAGGFKIVHMVPKDQLQTLAQYDEMVLKDQKLPTVNQAPTSSIVHTISE
jgi:peptidoglycan/xylan/chitin deacetylase (PgdA/CDA1 family)